MGQRYFFPYMQEMKTDKKKKKIIKLITAIVRISPVRLWYVGAQEVWEE